MTILRSKFIGFPQTNLEQVEFLSGLTSREFEHVIEELYHSMEYDTELTPATRDGGHDIIATKQDIGRKEVISVECKLYTSPVGVEHVRNLKGVISYNGCNKGILFTSAYFSTNAISLAKQDHSIELVPGPELVTLLNEYLGTEWPIRLEKIIHSSQRRCSKTNESKS